MGAAIHIDAIGKRLGARDVLKGVRFDVEVGDIFGYLGPNGAGKTTTIRILLGLLRPDSGHVEVLGQDVGLASTRLHIGFALDPDGLYDALSARENCRFYAELYGVKRVAARVDKVLDLVGLADRGADRVGTFSKGMRQRLSLARAMVHDPQVLILDAPSSGVDPSGQIELRQLLLDIAGSEHKTVLLSSHNLDEVQRICNRVALIDQGEIRLYGELDGLRQSMGRGGLAIETRGPVAESVVQELLRETRFGFRAQSGSRLEFEAGPDRAELSDIIGFLATRGVKIEQAGQREASLEDLYASMLRQVDPT
ncbi:MAG: ABC transporter ATP-binding protein [Pseudomonadota bacterium]